LSQTSTNNTTINPYGRDVISVETEFCGRPLRLEINRVGFRTTASVLVTYGETVVLGTAMTGNVIPGMDYFPLSIDYEERFYAAGKISGSRFIKREGKPSDESVLVGRLIDRPIRPLWPKGYRNEVQGVATVLSLDPSFRPDMIAMIAMSTAFMLTGAPFEGPVAGVRVGIDKDGKYQAFMSAAELAASKLDLVVAGTDGKVMMVEAGAKEATELEVIKAMEFAVKAIEPALKLQQELVKKVGVTPTNLLLALARTNTSPCAASTTKLCRWPFTKMFARAL
jgi:polyribonucleotide nucleotidyltransferase